MKLTGNNKRREGHLHVVLNVLMLDNIGAEWDGPSQSCHSHWLVPYITCSMSLSLRKTKKTISNLRLEPSTLGTEKNGKYTQKPVKPKIVHSDKQFSQWEGIVAQEFTPQTMHCISILRMFVGNLFEKRLDKFCVFGTISGVKYPNNVSSDLSTISGHFLLDVWLHGTICSPCFHLDRCYGHHISSCAIQIQMPM